MKLVEGPAAAGPSLIQADRSLPGSISKSTKRRISTIRHFKMLRVVSGAISVLAVFIRKFLKYSIVEIRDSLYVYLVPENVYKKEVRLELTFLNYERIYAVFTIIWKMIIVNFMFLLSTALGLIIFGLGPSLVAGHEFFREFVLRDVQSYRIRDYWHTYKTN